MKHRTFLFVANFVKSAGTLHMPFFLSYCFIFASRKRFQTWQRDPSICAHEGEEPLQYQQLAYEKTFWAISCVSNVGAPLFAAVCMV